MGALSVVTSSDRRKELVSSSATAVDDPLEGDSGSDIDCDGDCAITVTVVVVRHHHHHHDHQSLDRYSLWGGQ